MSIKKNILVIGETGVGKSSLINLILESNQTIVSDSAQRGTLCFTKYRYGIYQLVDTVGFNDAEERNVTESLENLERHALEMETNGEGIVLIIYIMKRGRLTKTSTTNYDYFVKTFCENNVPVMLVVTHCECDLPDADWFLENDGLFTKKGMKFAGHVCGCTKDVTGPNVDPDMAPVLAKKRSRTLHAVRENIRAFALAVSWQPKNWKEWYRNILLGLVVFGITAAMTVLKKS